MTGLPAPYYDHGGVTIYHNDCRDILPLMPACTFDVAFADPPYGVGFDYGNGYDDTAVHADVVPMLRTIAATVLVTTGISNLWSWPAPTWALCWAKPGSTRRSLLHGFNEWEPVLVYGRPGPIYHDLRILPSVANLAKGDTGCHPCPKPLALLRWLIAECSTGGPVIDPFAGSGTTLVAAKERGLSAVGIEIEERFCEIAARRVEQGVLPFDNPPRLTVDTLPL
jgi:site-specific DNA-methyltransferase (adenine-specific)